MKKGIQINRGSFSLVIYTICLEIFVFSQLSEYDCLDTSDIYIDDNIVGIMS